MNPCIFIDPPQECVRHVKNLCVQGNLTKCLLNHRRLMLTKKGRTLALNYFIEEILDSPDRKKPVAGQIGRDLIS